MLNKKRSICSNWQRFEFNCIGSRKFTQLQIWLNMDKKAWLSLNYLRKKNAKLVKFDELGQNSQWNFNFNPWWKMRSLAEKLKIAKVKMVSTKFLICLLKPKNLTLYTDSELFSKWLKNSIFFLLLRYTLKLFQAQNYSNQLMQFCQLTSSWISYQIMQNNFEWNNMSVILITKMYI